MVKLLVPSNRASLALLERKTNTLQHVVQYTTINRSVSFLQMGHAAIHISINKTAHLRKLVPCGAKSLSLPSGHVSCH